MTFTRVLAHEVAGTGVRVQVVCPGYTATQFHLTNTDEPVSEEALAAARNEPDAMSADDVVTASLTALERGEVVCVPGLDEAAALDQLADAEAALRRAGRATNVAQRYQG